MAQLTQQEYFDGIRKPLVDLLTAVNRDADLDPAVERETWKLQQQIEEALRMLE